MVFMVKHIIVDLSSQVVDNVQYGAPEWIRITSGQQQAVELACGLSLGGNNPPLLFANYLNKNRLATLEALCATR